MEFHQLMNAIDHKKHIKIKRILKKNPTLLNSKNGRLLTYTASIGDLDIVRYLIHNGANINIGSPVEKACENGHANVAIYLIEYGCKYDITMALMFSYDNLQLVKYFIKKGSYTDCSKNWCMLQACIKGNYMVVDLFASKFGIDNQCILWASFYKNVDILYILSKYKSVEYFPDDVKTSILFFKKNYMKIQHTMAKKIYFWWLQLCYNANTLCSHNVMYKEYKKMKLIIMLPVLKINYG